MKKKKKKKIWAWIAASIAFLAIVAAGMAWWAWTWANAQYQGEKAQRIYIPAGSDTQAIADTLSANLGHEYASRVMRLWQWQKGTERRAHGSFVIEPGTTALHASRMLKLGMQTPVKVTFNNLRTVDDFTQKVSANIEATPEQVMQALDSALTTRGVKRELYTAMILPDTHEFYWTVSPTTLVDRLLQAHDAFWTPERQQAAKALGLTPEQVVTLASIVEEETAKADERPKVARLYLNRLQKGMLLQADPTVKFAVGDFGLRRILSKHLQTDSPYNTYKYAGLPPGPIRVASKAGIDAVLHPASHNYLYMCAKEDFSGYHNFASSYDQHLANARRYQQALNRLNIK